MAHLNRLINALCDVNALRKLITDASDKHVNEALLFATMRGELRAVQILIPESSRDGIRAALGWAAAEGMPSLVAEFINAPNANDDDQAALRHAVQNGHLDIVKMLIPFGDTTARTAFALRLAVKNYGRDKILTQLISNNRDSLGVVFLYEVTHAKANENGGSLELIERLFCKVTGEIHEEASTKIDRSLLQKIPSFVSWFASQHQAEKLRESLALIKAQPIEPNRF